MAKYFLSVCLGAEFNYKLFPFTAIIYAFSIRNFSVGPNIFLSFVQQLSQTKNTNNGSIANHNIGAPRDKIPACM